jgi:23S rRNA (guanosine2251-2'-O)-methyltransferase
VPMNPEPSDTIIYGIHPVAELVTHRLRQVDRIYFDATRNSGSLFDLVKLCRKERLSYQMVPPGRLAELAGPVNHQGVVALCGIKEFTSPESLLSTLETKTSPALLFLPASVEDPRNLGSLVRTCVAFGVDAILLERKNTAPINATVGKTSAGMIEHISLVKSKNLEGLVADLKKRGFVVVGAEAGGKDTPQDIDFTGPVILITGGEDRGIPPYLSKLCDRRVSIPMTKISHSLNVGTAAAVLLYECCRQRNFPFSR